MSTLEQMAREAGSEELRGIHPGMVGFYPAQLARFAALVRADERSKALDDAYDACSKSEQGGECAAILALKDKPSVHVDT